MSAAIQKKEIKFTKSTNMKDFQFFSRKQKKKMFTFIIQHKSLNCVLHEIHLLKSQLVINFKRNCLKIAVTEAVTIS